jgi:hypothetical protein
MQLAFRLLRAVPSLCIIRKDKVFAEPTLWPDLVRFGHLCEGRKFREALQNTIRRIIKRIFHPVPVAELPMERIRVARHKRKRIFDLYDSADLFSTSFRGLCSLMTMLTLKILE